MSPAKGEPSPRKGQKYPPEVLTSDEVRRLLDQCSKHAPTGVRNRALITLLYRSGLRISEALGDAGTPERPPRRPLRVSDINMDEHSIRVLDTKSGHAQTRGFHPSADDALMRWLATRRELGINGHHAVFCTLEGNPLNVRYVGQMLHRIAAEAGIDKRVTPHAFRHTFACELEAQGVPVTTISKLLGHSGMAVTSKYLDHLSNHQAVEALAGVHLPSFGGEQAPEAAANSTGESSADLEAIRSILGDPDAVKALAGIARAAQARRKRTTTTEQGDSK